MSLLFSWFLLLFIEMLAVKCLFPQIVFLVCHFHSVTIHFLLLPHLWYLLLFFILNLFTYSRFPTHLRIIIILLFRHAIYSTNVVQLIVFPLSLVSSETIPSSMIQFSSSCYGSFSSTSISSSLFGSIAIS